MPTRIRRLIGTAWATCAWLLAVAPREVSAERIHRITIADNSKTTDDTVRYLADIQEGEEWDADREEEVRLQLIESGLFKDVQITSETAPQGGVNITILAEDKHSWVIAPTYFYSKNNHGGGVGFVESNLFGWNKQVLVFAQLATGTSFVVAGYRAPMLFGTGLKLRIDGFARRERVFEFAPQNDYFVRGATRGNPENVRESRMKTAQGGVILGYEWLRNIALEGRSKVAKVRYERIRLGDQASESDIDAGLEDGCIEAGTCELPEPGGEGWDVNLGAGVRFGRIANHYGITSGDRYEFLAETSIPALGSDFRYWLFEGRLHHARRFVNTGNLVIEGGFSKGFDLPFHAELTAGGANLRGYKNQQFRGDLLATLTVEYSFRLFQVKGVALRPLFFVDGAYVGFFHTEGAEERGVRAYLPDFDQSRAAGLRTSAGIGTRLYVRQVVLPLLGVDVGYGFESGGIEIYLALGASKF